MTSSRALSEKLARSARYVTMKMSEDMWNKAVLGKENKNDGVQPHQVSKQLRIYNGMRYITVNFFLNVYGCESLIL